MAAAALAGAAELAAAAASKSALFLMFVVFGSRKDTFAIGPDTASYESVTVSADALVGALAAQLEAAGYSNQLHTALRRVAQYMAGESEETFVGQDMLFLQNTIVHRNTPEEQMTRKARRTQMCIELSGGLRAQQVG